MRSRLLVVLLLTACAAPQRPVDLGFKQVPSDVILGGSAAPSAPTPSVTQSPLPLIPPPSVISLPPPPFAPGPATSPPPVLLPPAPSCPPEDPLAAPKLEAVSTVAKPPVPATYVFANDGTFATSGADPRTGRFPALTTRTVGNVVSTVGSFTYDVAETIGDTTTTTTYQVVTGSTLQSNGIFLQGMTYRRADGTTASFTPLPSPLLAAFPLTRGATSDQRVVDPATQTTMTFTTTVEGKARVVACGEPLDTWTVHLTQGTLLGPSENLQFDATYQLATQFGGLVVADAVAFTGTEGADGVQRSNKARITTVPRTP